MRVYVEVRVDKSKQLPPGAASALAIELNNACNGSLLILKLPFV